MQIAALAVTAVLCAAVIRRGAPEAALVLVLAAGCWMLMLAAGALGSVVEAIGRLAGRAGLDSTCLLYTSWKRMQSSLKFDEGYCNFSGTRYPIKIRHIWSAVFGG